MESASLWGCELKYSCWYSSTSPCCQPPCEAVSWNVRLSTLDAIFSVSLLVRLWVEMPFFPLISTLYQVSLLVRLWVEMKSLLIRKSRKKRQPPCEAVSWNVSTKPVVIYGWGQPPCEAVSWNDRFNCNILCRVTVSLLVRLWVEIDEMMEV